ncbi:Ig-like domain-containing protein [Methanobacterium bryantii]|uniref:Ig-like domain-containing protein n=1 Tax=Methanobacterium bryantii TaxID=2161 RepID=UPI0021007DB2|nr:MULTISPECIES: Ig-like domain-containing protein [Methanobacterium]
MSLSLSCVSADNTTVNTTSSNLTNDLNSPTVKSVDPTNKSIGVAVNKVIKVTFSESINAGTYCIKLRDTSGKTVSVTKSINGNVLMIKPTANLTNGTKYTLLIYNGSVTDLSGNNVSAYTSTFTTDGTAPTVKSVDPANKATSISVSKTIKVKFGESIKMGSGWIELKNSNGKSVSFTKSIYKNVLTINPKSNLATGTEYTLIIHSGSLTDLSGNKYVYKGSTSFTTYSTYLKSTANCQVTNSKIKAMATKLTKSKTTVYAKAVAIYNWVRNNIDYSYYSSTRYGAVGTLSKGSGNCVDTAHLLIALLRASGVQARYKHVKAKFSSGNWYGHVYAQVYVNGKWYNADATSSRNSFGVIKNWNTATATYKGTYVSLPF